MIIYDSDIKGDCIIRLDTQNKEGLVYIIRYNILVLKKTLLVFFNIKIRNFQIIDLYYKLLIYFYYFSDIYSFFQKKELTI